MDKVLVKDGRNAEKYHKEEDGMPACIVTGHADPDNWRAWELEEAKVWKDECMNGRCYGDPDKSGVKTGDKWPV